MIAWLKDADDPLPDTRQALPADSDVPGLLAAGGELTPRRLTEAYSKGVFPWYSGDQPVLWWSPDPRMVLLVDEFKPTRSLRKTLARFARTPAEIAVAILAELIAVRHGIDLKQKKPTPQPMAQGQ